MKHRVLFFIVVILVGTTAALSQKTASGLNLKYDKFKDYTLISTQFLKLYPSNSFSSDDLQIAFTANVGFDGQTLNADSESFQLHFMTRSREWRFLRTHDLTILADGKRISAGGGVRTGNVNGGPGVTVSESLIYSIVRKDFQMIAGAKSVEFQVGTFETQLSKSDIMQLQLTFLAGTK